MSPSLGAKSKIIGFKSSTKPFPLHGFLKTAATETNSTGSFSFFASFNKSFIYKFSELS